MIDDRTVAAASYAGGATSVVSALTLTDIGIIVGIITAIATFAFNVWYRHRHFKLEEQDRKDRLAMERLEHFARLEALKREQD